VFFFEDFLNFSTSRHLIFSPFSTHAREQQHANIQRRRRRRRRRRERKRDQVESRLVSVVFMVVLVEE